MSFESSPENIGKLMMNDDKLRLQGYDDEKTPVVSNSLIKRLIINILYQMMKM